MRRCDRDGAAGWILGASAVDRALHPPLRVLLEQRHGGLRSRPAGDARLEEPVVVEGRLRADATLTETGVIAAHRRRAGRGRRVSRARRRRHLRGRQRRAARRRIAQWRAGRVVRAPVLLRRPARYLNGACRIRSVRWRAAGSRWSARSRAPRSSRWSTRPMVGGSRGGFVPRTRAALARHVAATRRPSARRSPPRFSSAIGRDSIDDVERRLQEAGTYHVIAISGGNIAILAGLVLGGLRWLAACAAVSPRCVTIVALASLRDRRQRRRLGRARDADGGDLSGRAPDRSAHGGGQRRGAERRRCCCCSSRSRSPTSASG